MEYINDINIQEAVIHVLDSGAGEPILNNYKLELNEENYKFLYKHIEKCVKDDELKYAVFNPERSIVKEVVQDYLNGIDSNIISLSQEIARQLFAVMNGNSSIPSCDLIVASIITDQGPMIAILKMDYVKSFTHQIDFIENKVGVNLVQQISALPGSSQRIQKAAFIKPIREEDSYNLMILDKHKKKATDEEEYGANYWVNNFLGCNIVINDRDQTRNFINYGETWVRNNYPEEADKAEEIRQAMRNKLLKDDVINIEEFAEEVLKNEGAANNFKMFMSAVCEEKIRVDKKYAEKKLNKIKINIDKDIQLIISKEAYEDKTKFDIQRNGDGSINMIIKYVSNYSIK